MGDKARRAEIRGALPLALLLASTGCKTSDPESGRSRPPLVVPECDFGLHPIAPDEPAGPYTPRTLSTRLTGDYRILITWVTGQHDEVAFSLTVPPDGTLLKQPLNAECNKPPVYLISYALLEQGSTTSSDEFVLAPIRDNFVRMKHPLRVALVPESAFPPEASEPNLYGDWTLDHVELGLRWQPSTEGTVAEGKILAWYTRPGSEARLTSALLGLAAVYPESSFLPSPKEPPDDLEVDEEP